MEPYLLPAALGCVALQEVVIVPEARGMAIGTAWEDLLPVVTRLLVVNIGS